MVVENLSRKFFLCRQGLKVRNPTYHLLCKEKVEHQMEAARYKLNNSSCCVVFLSHGNICRQDPVFNVKFYRDHSLHVKALRTKRLNSTQSHGREPMPDRLRLNCLNYPGNWEPYKVHVQRSSSAI